MRAHYLQHVPFEGLGSIAPWLNDNDYETTSTGFFQSTELPDPDAIDVLIVMGGSMSANDERLFPWLVAEKAFLRHFIQSGKPVLAICLGAQLIASALGARLFSNRFKEIGWFPVHRVEAADVNAFSFPAATEVFHWHGETFDLPQGARLIGANDACRHQAFQVGDSVIGFQFHLETTPAVAQAIVANCRDELLPSRYVQLEEEMLSATPGQYAAINRLMGEVLAYLTRPRVDRSALGSCFLQ